MIIGLVGLKGSGKDTAGNYISEKYSFQKDSFASTLKDIVSCMFGWDREMLEGETPESRKAREEIDEWWSDQLGMQWTPRYALQYIGTDILRQKFFDAIWVKSLEKRVLENLDKNLVITDIRFPNELSTLSLYPFVSIRIIRGDLPEWYSVACKANSGDEEAMQIMKTKYKDVHASEYALAGHDTDYTIYNNGSLEDLYRSIDNIMVTILSDTHK